MSRPDHGNTSKFAAFFRLPETNPKLKGSDPDVVAKAIEKSITAQKPKIRYVVGRLAKLSMFINNLMSDRMTDKFMNRMMG